MPHHPGPPHDRIPPRDPYPPRDVDGAGGNDRIGFPGPPPAAGEPLDGVDDVLAIARLAITLPLRAELIVLLLDQFRSGHTISVFEHGESMLDEVLRVVGQAVSGSDMRTCVLVSVRPGGGPESADDRRWRAADAALAASGVELLEWLVVGRRGVTSIPDRLGLTSRW